MKNEKREGHYKDKYGNWQPDRRRAKDRRNMGRPYPLDHERRKMFRRLRDRETFEKDHKAMIDEALDDFAEEHGGHL